MASLRQRMLEDMQVRRLSPCTQRTYVETVARFARYFDRSPARLGPEDIRAYQVHLTTERRLAPSSLVVAVSALRFLYRVTLQKRWVSCRPSPAALAAGTRTSPASLFGTPSHPDRPHALGASNAFGSELRLQPSRIEVPRRATAGKASARLTPLTAVSRFSHQRRGGRQHAVRQRPAFLGHLRPRGPAPGQEHPENRDPPDLGTPNPRKPRATKSHSNRHIPMISKSVGASPEKGLKYPERPRSGP